MRSWMWGEAYGYMYIGRSRILLDFLYSVHIPSGWVVLLCASILRRQAVRRECHKEHMETSRSGEEV